MAGLAVLVVLVSSSAALAAERVALIVGNSNYQHVGSLENPVNDASDIAIALEGLGFEVILGNDLTHSEMADAAARFSEAAKDADAAIFYYAGHGFQVGGQNYLVPTDAAIAGAEDVASQTTPLGTVLQALEQSKGLKLVFLDACRDNPFGAALQSVPGGGNGLARVGTAADFLFAYATQPDNVAYDGTGRNSFFTEAMLNHIYTPGQDIADLMIAVRRDVLAATGGRQIPWENSSLTRQFRFDNRPVTASEETLLWQVAADAGDPQLMQLYVDRYPQGSHVDDVVAFLDAEQTGTRTRTVGLGDADEQAERLWNLARRNRMRPLLEFYINQYPEGAHVAQAQQLLQVIPRAEDATPGGICERLTTHPRDATAGNAGVPYERLQRNALAAVQACSAAVAQSPELPHYVALLARATAASGDMERAAQLYRSAAAQGDLRAMVSLAQLMESGTAMPADPAGALALYEKAAEAGSTDAMINLAVSLFQGAGLPKDEARAITLLKRAASEGSPKARYNLGVLAQDGVVDSPQDALAYFESAARDGEYDGYRAAAVLLDEGRGVPRDPAKAANMLLRGAAEDRGAVLSALTEYAGDWSRETITAVQERLKAAGYYESTVDGLPGPNFTAALERWRNGGFTAEVLVN
ncbi:caspase family protein [Defluviimonas sp. WL0024]|uniref:Caspase family protein n=1 Tax=Albidovulum salinarum TaxID=2984153 RepID=A0ABT2X7E4_9RHOB|nr:caspase family protein [Defluviimonas sp. WL0024]MCU9849868.1 caspase family protein [Defluviimonas sp. WL0024]